MKQHYISRSLIKRWADEDGNVGVVCTYHRDSAKLSGAGLHWTNDLSSDEQEKEWSNDIENEASLVLDELQDFQEANSDDASSLEAVLTEPTNHKSLIDFVVLHHARSLSVPMKQLFSGNKALDADAAEAAIAVREEEAQSYHKCGMVVTVLPPDVRMPLGAIPVFNTSDWDNDKPRKRSGRKLARYMMPLTPQVVIAGDPAMKPGKVRVTRRGPKPAKLLSWQLAGEPGMFPTPFLICQPRRLEQVANKVLSRTVGGVMHLISFLDRVDMREVNPCESEDDENQGAEWRRSIQDLTRLQGLQDDRTRTRLMRKVYRKKMIKKAARLQMDLDGHQASACGCPQLKKLESQEVRAMRKLVFPQIICDAIRAKRNVPAETL